MADVATRPGWPVAAAVFGIFAVGVTWLALRFQALPEGPRPVVWDKEACAHCRMHVSEPPFASQLVTADGEVLQFDDPGCLFRYVAANHPAIHHAWFHDKAADRWIEGKTARFVPVEMSPMGYLRGAVDASAPESRGGRSFEEEVAAVEALPPERR